MLSARYRQLELIGEGVSARVYKALDTHTSSVVAVKVLSPHLATDAVGLERFRREVQITRFLGHPQIVSIYDLVADGDETYLVMEYIAGESLKAFIQRRAPVDPATALDVLGQVLGILSVCHAKGVIHRDLKPQNAILTPEGVVKLVDFGISRMTALADLTQTGTSLGSPEYMAPELFAANVYDPRTDLYALGVILFELLTGRLPFPGDSLPVLYRQHLTAPVPPLERPDVPAWLEQMVARMLAKQPHERYQSADEVAADVEHRRVIANELPRLPGRECVACGAATVAELPWCTSCGWDLAGGLRQGRFDVCATETTDDAALARWVRTALVLPAPPPTGRRAVLVSRLERTSAELVRQSAERHGVVLAIEPHAGTTPLKRAAALVGAAFFGLSGAANLLASLMPTSLDAPFAFVRSPEEYVFLSLRGVAFLLLAWVCAGIFRRQTPRALVGDRGAVLAEIAREYAWLRELVPAAGPRPAGTLRGLLPRMIEHYLLVVRSGASLDGGLREALARLLRGAAEAVRVASEIETARDAAALARLAAAYTALTDTLAVEEDAARCEALERRRRRVVEELEQAYALEDAQARLLGRLIRLQCRFNALLGRLLVLRVAPAGDDRDALAEAVRELGAELDVARQVHADIRRAA